VEPVGKLADTAGVGTAERVRRGVRVGERDQRPTVTGHQLEQVELGRVGVGQLVKVHNG
jgi:hypothetical protein